MYLRTSSCKVPVIILRFSSNLAFLDRFSKTPQMSNFIKLRPLGAELFHADGQTHRRDEGYSRFLQFCQKRPLAAKNVATVMVGIIGYRMAVSLTRPFFFNRVSFMYIYNGCQLYSAGFFENCFLLSWSRNSPHLRISNHCVR
jgi:hypothetical protein